MSLRIRLIIVIFHAKCLAFFLFLFHQVMPGDYISSCYFFHLLSGTSLKEVEGNSDDFAVGSLRVLPKSADFERYMMITSRVLCKNFWCIIIHIRNNCWECLVRRRLQADDILALAQASWMGRKFMKRFIKLP